MKEKNYREKSLKKKIFQKDLRSREVSELEIVKRMCAYFY